MALQKEVLKAALIAGFQAIEHDGTSNTERLCDAIANAIDVYIKTGEVTVVQADGGSFDIDDDVNLVIVNANHSTVDLPNPGGNSSRVITVKVDGSFADVTLRTDGGTIDGGATYSLGGTYKSVTVWSDGSDWLILNEVVH